MFSLPDHGTASFVKRVIASEGDRVAIQNGVLSVNGISASYEPVDVASGIYRESMPGQEAFPVKWDKTKIENYGPVDVPPGYFFALGDNRLDNNDSRAWGPVPYACLKGKPAMVWFSIEPDGNWRKHRFAVWVRS
jgi:signal peptidase I